MLLFGLLNAILVNKQQGEQLNKVNDVTVTVKIKQFVYNLIVCKTDLEKKTKEEKWFSVV